MNELRSACCVLLIVLCAPFAAHADTATTVRDQCASCHAIDKPDYAALGFAERGERKAPPLYYAGNKFQLEWLQAWLQKPVAIRPAGVVPAAHVRATPQGDVVDSTTLSEHAVLSAETAVTVAQWLMQLRPFDERLAAQSYQPGEVALRMGQMNFSKFKGCDACHRDSPQRGGESGPELHTAWERLQPAFLASYIADPVFWDPHTMMPRVGLNDVEVHKLADYLKALREAQP